MPCPSKPLSTTAFCGAVSLRGAVLFFQSLSLMSAVSTVALTAFILGAFRQIAASLHSDFGMPDDDIESLKVSDMLMLMVGLVLLMLHSTGIHAVRKGKTQAYKAYVVCYTVFTVAVMALQLTMLVLQALPSGCGHHRRMQRMMGMQHGNDDDADSEMPQMPQPRHMLLARFADMAFQYYVLRTYWRYVRLQRAEADGAKVHQALEHGGYAPLQLEPIAEESVLPKYVDAVAYNGGEEKKALLNDA
ncbi:hypothetical protein RI367_006073 [Sorochytrium milnesiophthora]